jgi:hypothetical protein
LGNKTVTPEERSRALRREADEVLSIICLREHGAHVGEFVPTGSYFMDLMMYPDIDLYLPPATAEDLLRVAVSVSRYDCVSSIDFRRGGPGELEDGLYLKPIVEHGNWERPWKIDIWSLPRTVVDSKQGRLADLKSRMTPENRDLILRTKYKLLTPAGRTPMFSGLYIYEAVVDHGLSKLEAIVEYLKSNGLDV